MATISPYAPRIGAASKFLTDQPNPAAPQTGVHVYHFFGSLCSQKVRMMMVMKGVDFESHHVVLPVYDQYEAEYVRINPRCVVPTLVVDGKVTTDANNILEYIERKWPGSDAPLTEAQLVEMHRQSNICDEMPIEALTYGANPDGDKRPGFMKKLTAGGHAHKEELLKAKIKQYADDSNLVESYKGKLAIVSQYRGVVDSPDQMRKNFEQAQADLEELQKKLADPKDYFQTHGFLCAERMTLADVEWCIIICRLKEIGYLDNEKLARLPDVATYCNKMRESPAYLNGVKAYMTPKFILPNVAYPIIKAKCAEKGPCCLCQ